MINFVGAGPGAVDLISLRGKALIEKADVIIYAGSLVNPGLLEFAKETAKIYDSAKMTLEEVLDVMKAAVGTGKDVVRLHTGDQSIYGAIREQMDALDGLGIAYDSCPGITAACAAAASLDLEYTLPDISQTLIITRMEGRTPVPAKESIETLAAHQASMAIYLSTGMLDKLSERLIAGGYKPDTPAALVYKASWPEEEKYICTVGNLADTAREHNIRKTAIVLVGDVIACRDYSRSKLYDPSFSTEYRKAEMDPELRSACLHKAAVNGPAYSRSYRAVCFSIRGAEVLKRIINAAEAKGIEIPEAFYSFSTGKAPEGFEHIEGKLKDWVEEGFKDNTTLIFIGAAGIAVRAIAPFVKDKLSDSAVIVIDDNAQNVIPLLSGHAGGANKTAVILAELLNAQPVITTSSDINDAFSADVFAEENRLKIINRDGIKKVSAKAIEGKAISLSIKDYPPKEPVDIIVADDTDREYSLLLSPKKYTLGMGMKKDTPFEKVEEFALKVLNNAGISADDIYAVCTIDIKENEPGLKAFSKKYRIPLISFEAELLNKVSGDFASSDFVKKTTGTDNVCERAAVLGAGGGELLVHKTTGGGITAAVAIRRA